MSLHGLLVYLWQPKMWKMWKKWKFQNFSSSRPDWPFIMSDDLILMYLEGHRVFTKFWDANCIFHHGQSKNSHQAVSKLFQVSIEFYILNIVKHLLHVWIQFWVTLHCAQAAGRPRSAARLGGHLQSSLICDTAWVLTIPSNTATWGREN